MSHLQKAPEDGKVSGGLGSWERAAAARLLWGTFVVFYFNAKKLKRNLTWHPLPTFPIIQGKCQTDVLKGWKNEMKGTFRIYRAENQKPVEIRTSMSAKLSINA